MNNIELQKKGFLSILWKLAIKKTAQFEWPDWKVILFASVFFVIFENFAFWKKFFSLLEGTFFANTLFTLSVLIVMLSLIYMLFSLVLWQYLFKPLLTLIFLISAGISYFMTAYGVYIDRDMIANITHTTPHESFALMTPQFLLWIVLFGVLPSLFLWRIRIIYKTPFWKNIIRRLLTIALAMVAIAAAIAPLYQDYAAFFRMNKPIMKLVNPTNYVYGSMSYASQTIDSHRPLIQIGLDAKVMTPAASHKPTLFILVVGETSRAQNTGLYGYEKNTNPLLSKQSDLLAFAHTTSCGTNTATSVPCMFSNMPRTSYDPKKASHMENFLDIFARLGIHVFWKENDNGCFSVCTRVLNINIPDSTPSEDCPENLCYDEHLLDNLDKYIADNKQGDIFIVLHTNGSHGPSYFKRYPKDMPNQFSPTCDTDQIQNCSHEALVNTYDNTMVHVDAMLNQTIEFLKGHNNQYDTGMFYLSDHGESLGENGIYLHSFPYMIAPKEQTHIPMFFWSNPEFLTARNINYSCMQKHAATGEFSQDNLFHTMLGVMNISTKEYDAKLDAFAPCRQSL